MRRIKALVLGALLVATSTASMAGGGCLAGRYTYFDDEGQVVGGETVGCPSNSAWGTRTGNSTFAAGCAAES